jgi:hypothetical protein
METGKNGVGSKQKRGREKEISRLREQVMYLGENLKWRGLRNDHRKRHLSISNK